MPLSGSFLLRCTLLAFLCLKQIHNLIFQNRQSFIGFGTVQVIYVPVFHLIRPSNKGLFEHFSMLCFFQSDRQSGIRKVLFDNLLWESGIAVDEDSQFI